ncbi:MAG: hypothetical protein ACK56I_12160, partial [bacterium]
MQHGQRLLAGPLEALHSLRIWPGDRKSDPLSISSASSCLSASIFSSSAAQHARIERIISWRADVSPVDRDSLDVSMSAFVRASSSRSAAAAASCASRAP